MGIYFSSNTSAPVLFNMEHKCEKGIPKTYCIWYRDSLITNLLSQRTHRRSAREGQEVMDVHEFGSPLGRDEANKRSTQLIQQKASNYLVRR